jgi:polysaccharide biosynthesis transport protein
MGVPTYLDFARRRGWVIVVVTVLAIGGAYAVTRLLPKTYEATASLFVGSITARNQTEANAVLYNGLVSENLDRSYAVFATSTTTLRDAEARLGRHIGRDDIEAAPVPNSQILEIKGTASKAQVAAARANAVSDTLVSAINGRRTIPEARLRVVNRASPPSKPAEPKLRLNLALGALVGLLLGYATALIWERL